MAQKYLASKKQSRGFSHLQSSSPAPGAVSGSGAVSGFDAAVIPDPKPAPAPSQNSEKKRAAGRAPSGNTGHGSGKKKNPHVRFLKQKTLNIEPGDRLTKVCVSQVKRGKCQIRYAFLFQTPENAVSDGEVVNPDALAVALWDQLAARKLTKVKNAVFTLASTKVATREVSLPLVKDNRLKDIVKTNAPDYFPVDLSKYYVSYCLLDRVEKGENAGCRVLVFAAPLQLLQSYFQFAEKAGLKLKNIDFAGNSLYQALHKIRSEALTMYISIDCTSSCVTFLKDSRFLLQRMFLFGGDELINNYIKNYGQNGLDYAEALRECGRDDAEFTKTGSEHGEEIIGSFSRLVGNIVRSVNYFNSSHWDQPVEKVVLLGPCSRLPGLREMVASGTGLPSAYLDAVPAIGFSFGPDEKLSSYVSCGGSNLAPLDLLPPQFRSDKKSARKQGEKSDKNSIRDGIILCGLCVAVTVAISAFALFRYTQALAEKIRVQNQISALTYTESDYKTYVEYKAEDNSLKSLSGSLSTPNDSLTGFLKELEQKMPSQILLLSATCDKDKISMNITVPKYSDVAVVLVQLRTFKSLQDISVGSVSQTTDQSGGSYVMFPVTCTYGANPYLNGTNPYAALEKSKNNSASAAGSQASSASGTASSGEAKP